MATATAEVGAIDRIEAQIPCPGCKGLGYLTNTDVRIDPKHLPFHVKNHAYTLDRAMGQIIGANCDCPRVVGKETRSSCYGCKGTGTRQVILSVPKPGNKVNVKDPELLTSIFGEGAEPDKPGIVFDTQVPEEHRLELQTGLGVRVTWDKLTKDNTIPRGKEVALWTFDLLELEIVRR